MNNKPTFPDLDEVWKLVRETQKNLKDISVRQKEFQASQKAYQEAWEKRAEKAEKEREARQKEFQASQKAYQEAWEKRAEKAEKEMKRFQAQQERTDRMIQKVGGRFNKRWGHLVESLVKGKLVHLLRERGIQVNQTLPNVEAQLTNKDGTVQKRTEFDIIVANGKEVVIVEVKTVLSPKDLHHFLSNLQDFKSYFPKFKADTLYGAVAYLKSEGKAHVLSEAEGLFVIKAVGDSASLINKPDFKPKAFT